jgi:hypothetical protein
MPIISKASTKMCGLIFMKRIQCMNYLFVLIALRSLSIFFSTESLSLLPSSSLFVLNQSNEVSNIMNINYEENICIIWKHYIEAN